MRDAGYYIKPTIHGERIVFVCEDDLWEVPVGGGVARRLTASRGMVSAPRFSPDGSRIAFTGSDDGPLEVYVMDSGGGPAKRLTHLGTTLRTNGWTPDGKSIVFQSNAGRRFMRVFHLHTVPADGGRTTELSYGPAREIAYQRNGKGVVLGINSWDPAYWKRYRGGTAGRLWIDRGGKGEFEELIRLEGNLASPHWVGPRIYFLSDHEGHANLYSCTPAGRGLRRHTHHEDFFARFPDSDGKRIVYHAGADLHVYDVRSDESWRVDVSLQSPRSARTRRFVSAAEFLQNADLHPAGHSLACTARGGLFTLPLWEGAPVRHGEVSSARRQHARWLPDGKRVVAVSDEQGEEALEIRRADGRGRPKRIAGDLGRVLDLAVAPKGNRVAFSNHRTEVWVADTATGKARMVERSGWFRIHGLAWSPDGRWLAYGFQVNLRSSSIHLFDTQSQRTHEITRPDFLDVRPAFDPGGKYLYFLSHRVFDPVYDNQYFDLGFPRGMRPYLIPLAKSTPSPFDAATREPRPPAAHDAHEEDDDKKKKGAARVRIDLAGIADRVVAFPVPEAKYERVLGGHGRVYFSSVPVEGSLGSHWTEETEPTANATLEVYDFGREKAETLHASITDFSLSADAKVLLVQAGRRLRALPATIEPKEVSAKTVCGRETGWIALDRLRVAVVPGEEWKQMFREAWRLQRDHFWTPDMSKVDWRAVHDRYLPLVDRVASRFEFSDLLWEMQGELGTSHCYELGGDYRPSPEWFQGFLGADLEFKRTWRIERILRGDSWEPGVRSPLAAPGLNLREGDEILAVDGRSVGAKRTPASCLVHQAGREVVLTVRSRGGQPRQVTVKTLEQEFGLRYRDWVERTRERVHRATKGRVGYVHIPDMSPAGYGEFHRYFRTEIDRDGLIIDVRWNGGGHVSQLLLEKLLRKRVGYDASRWEGKFPYPMEAPMGPMVALTNEQAGSDGDIFSHCFKLFGLGPLIGKRTWGGVVGIWPRHSLVDGTITTQPEYAFWFVDVEWGVENYGTDPDIEVDIRPQDHAAGRDPQLERGLVEIRRILKEKKPKVPRLDKRPSLKPPKLQKPGKS